jgi:hypothetical protein
MRLVLGKAKGHDLPTLTLLVEPKYFCGADKQETTPEQKSQSQTLGNLTIRTRSVEEIFKFLGQMARTELGIGILEPDPLKIPHKEGGPYFHLFRIRQDVPTGEDISVFYAGRPYTISIDPSGYYDGSSRVVQLLTALLALQSSAKNLPAPNVISVISP